MLLYYHCHCHGKVSEEHITLCGQNEIFFFSSFFFFLLKNGSSNSVVMNQ